MALTVNITYRDRDGQSHRSYADITFDSSYPTGGEALALTTLGLARHLREIRFSEVSAGYQLEYDRTNEKVKAYWVDTTVDGAAMAEVANTTDLSTLTAKVVAIGY